MPSKTLFILIVFISLTFGQENKATETKAQEPTKQTGAAQEQTKELKHEANVGTEDYHKKATVLEEFKRSKLIPDLLVTSPQKILDVVYDSNREVQMGNELTPKLVINQPTVKFDGEYGSYYTLIMTDPDAPSRKDHSAREWNHWLVVNIPRNDLSKGETLSEYVGSAPPKGTGLHRYVFLLFKQPEKLQFHETHHSNTDGNRGKFNTEKFSQKYNLGAPVAGNYFQAKWDDSVPALHKQLGF